MNSVRIFMKCTHVCGPTSLLTLYQNINKPDSPSLANEIAEPHPDMNFKVVALIVSEKPSNTTYIIEKNNTVIKSAIYHVFPLDICGKKSVKAAT